MNEDYSIGWDAGYNEAYKTFLAGKTENHEQKKRKRQEELNRKLYFAGQKLLGVFVLLLTFVAVVLMDGDATLALVTAPLGCVLIFSKKRLLTVKSEEGEDEWW